MIAEENPLETTQCVVKKCSDPSENEYQLYHGVLITHYDVLCHVVITLDEDEIGWSVLASPLIVGKYFKKVSKIIKEENVAVLKVSICIEIVNRSILIS